MRARNIKPGFFKNEFLAECSFPSRILFIGLWCMADREGRLEYRPKQIKAECLPYDDVNIIDLLLQLALTGFIAIYKIDADLFIQIINFSKHQNPHVRESASTIPIPNDKNIVAYLGSDEHSARQVLEQCKQGARLPDSPSLIPESNILSSENQGSAQKEKIPYEEIVSYLNEKTGKQFKHSSQDTRRLIKARWANGFRLDDFKKVIDTKAGKWMNDPNMVDYLRPNTLFGTKFESYFNEKLPPNQQPQKVTYITIDAEDEARRAKERDELQEAIKRGELPKLSDALKSVTQKLSS